MSVVQRVIHRRGKFLFQEIWNCFHKKSESWDHLSCWIGDEVTDSDRIVLVYAAIFGINTISSALAHIAVLSATYLILISATCATVTSIISAVCHQIAYIAFRRIRSSICALVSLLEQATTTIGSSRRTDSSSAKKSQLGTLILLISSLTAILLKKLV